MAENQVHEIAVARALEAVRSLKARGVCACGVGREPCELCRIAETGVVPAEFLRDCALAVLVKQRVARRPGGTE